VLGIYEFDVVLNCVNDRLGCGTYWFFFYNLSD
jgi:hypothetical protein